MITAQQVKELRDRTNVSMMLCKKALEQTGGDVEQAILALRQMGELRAADVTSRNTSNGAVFAYIHPGNQYGAIVQVECESDFVAKGEDFLNFCKNVAMHIVASKPLFTHIAYAMGSEFARKEKDFILTQMLGDPKMGNKPEAMKTSIADNKLDKRLREVTLCDQPFIKDPTKTVDHLRMELIQKTGENIQIARFERFDLREGKATHKERLASDESPCK